MSVLPYRLNVGICLFNKDKKVFVGERCDTDGAWQMPQGGIDEGEDYETAAFRELYEETGVQRQHAEIIKVMDDFLYYDFPQEVIDKYDHLKPYKGQKQKWIAMRFLGKDSDINLTAYKDEIEFSQWRWIELENIIEYAVDFKTKVYKSVIGQFSKL